MGECGIGIGRVGGAALDGDAAPPSVGALLAELGVYTCSDCSGGGLDGPAWLGCWLWCAEFGGEAVVDALVIVAVLYGLYGTDSLAGE